MQKMGMFFAVVAYCRNSDENERYGNIRVQNSAIRL